MSFIDNVHASAQGLLNRGPPGARGPHNAGGPHHHHGGPHPGAGDRGFGGPKGGESANGVPRAIPGAPELPGGPRGVDRALPGQVSPGVERPNPGHVHTSAPGQVVQNTLDAAQGVIHGVMQRGSPNGPPAHASQGHGHVHHGRQEAAPAAMGAQPVMAAMQAGAASLLAAHAPGAMAGGATAPPPGTMPAGQPGAPARGDMAHQAAVPARADAASLQVPPPPRGGEGLPAPLAFRGDAVTAGLARPDAALPAQAAPPANPPTVATLAGATAAAGATMATTAAPPALPTVQATDARMAPGLTVADRVAQGVRGEAMSGTYTGEGPQRRRLRRGARALPGSLSALLVAMGAQGRTSGAGRDARDVERELQSAAMQWLFWLLAIIAYGCVGFALVGLMPPGGGTAVAITGRGWSGGFAVAGLLAGAGAWWFARHLARGNTPPSTPRDAD